MLVAGPLTDAAGLKVAFLALAVPILLIGLAAIGLPSLRELDPPTNVGSPREP